MKQSSSVLIFTVLVVHAYAAPQLITFKDGKLGVNFGGYHAGVGLGGLMGGGGTGGGLFAEAGTPYGQAAKAGLGGALESSGRAAGGLYAGATAGGNVKASTGLAGGLSPEKTAGTGYASAQAGNHVASSGLGGETSAGGASGFTFSGTKSFGVPKGVINEKEIFVQPVQNFALNSVEKKVNTDIIASNEVKAVPLTPASGDKQFNSEVSFETVAQPGVLVKEVYVQPPPVVEKHVVHTHYKPHRHHFHKTAYIGGYLGASADVPTPQQPVTVVYKAVQPVIEKRIDVGGDSSVQANANAEGAGQLTYTKQVSFQRNPTFFADIFNIPISTLNAVRSLLTNTAANTNVSIQKSASVQADSESPKHASSSSASSSEAHIMVQTPPASKIIDDIFAIPINTLGAVNKFLENNIHARKKVQVSQDGVGEPTKIRLGPHARKRANKNKVIVVQESVEKAEDESKDSE